MSVLAAEQVAKVPLEEMPSPVPGSPPWEREVGDVSSSCP